MTIKNIGNNKTIETEVVISSFIFNTDKQTLVANNAEHKLSFKEAELLKTLILQKNQIIKREDILNQIWGSDSFFNSRNLDVYITKLRSYFKVDDKIEILTIKGIGYRFMY